MQLKDLIKQGIIEEQITKESKTFENSPPIYKVKSKIQSCEGCFKLVKDRIVSAKKIQYPTTHWRRQCSVCKFYENPVTKAWDMSNEELTAYWRIQKLKK